LHQLALPEVRAVELTAGGHTLEAKFIEGSRANAPVLVFLHEGLGSIAQWRDFPADLSARTGCSALVYSRYGNGRSQPLGEPRPVSYMHDEARTLFDVLKAAGVRRAILLGHSDGASIALIAASVEHTSVQAVIAQAPHVFVEPISVESIARAKTMYESGDLRARLAAYHTDVDRTFYGWNDVWLAAAFRSWDIRENVRAIRAPIFVLQGENDEYGTLAQVDAIRENAGGSVDALVLSRCGHAPHRDRRTIVTAAIAAFIEQVLEVN
jgi:pimeloyl-ACP methyl ester carboxylesterase